MLRSPETRIPDRHELASRGGPTPEQAGWVWTNLTVVQLVTAGAPGSLAAAYWPEPSERARNAAKTAGKPALASLLTIDIRSP